MVKYTSRVKGLKALPTQNTKKDMASKVLEKPPQKVSLHIPPTPKDKKVKIASLTPAKKKAPPQSKPVKVTQPFSDDTIDQMTHVPFIHMFGSMDMPTFNMVQGIASNYLRMEHPMRLITKQSLGGDFSFPKYLSKIAMRDVMKAQSPQQLSHALHSEWVDKLDKKLTNAELGGGLFASLKTLVKKGVSGGKKALSSLASGAAQAVRHVSSGAKGAQLIGKSVSNALQHGLEVANSLAPIIQEVFPQTEGLLRLGLGHANASKELLDRGIDISRQVEKAIQPSIDILGPIDAPIIVSHLQDRAKTQQTPLGAGLDDMQGDPEDRVNEESGPRFVS